ncbi:hypothetical protein SteCoe_9511 [Stentor coeruleus]|uniref:DNA 3'-5' helicase n=1 Tax=Stentor coeruleus TaxID=5963 RepID=A0A1R2CHS2_9CILI|nr:hypothetical protein SteCoe_9511 [Stentor coeruleus]
MWKQDLSYIESLKNLFPNYQFNKQKKSKSNAKIILPAPPKIDFSILKIPESETDSNKNKQENKKKPNKNRIDQVPSLSLAFNSNLQSKQTLQIEKKFPPKEVNNGFSNQIKSAASERISLSLSDNLQANRPELSHPEPLNSNFPNDKELFGINNRGIDKIRLKKNQREIMNAILNGKDVFSYLPSGSGKSLAYQISALNMEGITFIITENIPLLQNQIKKLNDLGLNSIIINPIKASDIKKNCIKATTNPNIKLFFLSPKLFLENDNIIELIDKLHNNKRLSFFVIDETQYQNFNTIKTQSDYHIYRYLKGKYLKIPLLYLSSSPSLQIFNELIDSIKISPEYIIENPQRPNIFYQVLPTQENKKSQLITLIKTRFDNKTGIIYYNKNNKCYDFFKELQEKYSLNCIFYHSNHTQERKIKTLETWLNHKNSILISSSPLDIKFNNKSIRFIIHYQIPTSVFEFYHNSCYAGRDSLYSECIILYNFKNKKSFHNTFDSTTSKNKKNYFINEMYKILLFCEEKHKCRKLMISKYLESDKSFDCNSMCDNCKNYKENEDISNEDYDDAVMKIIDLLRFYHDKIWTVNRLKKFLLGEKMKDIEMYRRSGYGSFKDFKYRVFIKKIVLKMLLGKILEGVFQKNNGKSQFVVKLGGKCFEKKKRNMTGQVLGEDNERNRDYGGLDNKFSGEVEEEKIRYHDDIVLPFKRK